MNTTEKLQISSKDAVSSEKLGEKIGQALRGGEVIELVSDLGGGKTTFVRGLARGMGSTDNVASPTFTIRREYRAKDLTLYHFDFYRLSEPGSITNDLAEVIDQPGSVVVAEWADIVKGVMPENRLKIHIKATGDNSREFVFTFPKELDYLMRNLR